MHTLSYIKPIIKLLSPTDATANEYNGWIFSADSIRTHYGDHEQPYWAFNLESPNFWFSEDYDTIPHWIEAKYKSKITVTSVYIKSQPYESQHIVRDVVLQAILDNDELKNIAQIDNINVINRKYSEYTFNVNPIACYGIRININGLYASDGYGNMQEIKIYGY